MTEPEEDALDPELLAALRADVRAPNSAARERVSQRLATSIGTLALHGSPSSAAASPAKSALAVLRAHPLLFAVGFALGGGTGAAAVSTWRAPPAPTVRFVDRIVQPAPTSVVSALPAPPAPSAAPELAPPKAALAVSAVPASSERTGSIQLGEQLALLDVARRAFARSDYTGTLSTLHEHFERYPKSVLGEERAALEIKALASNGELGAARARALRFRAQFPQSLLWPSITDSTGPIP